MEIYLIKANQKNLNKMTKQELKDLRNRKGYSGFSIEFQAMVDQEIATRR